MTEINPPNYTIEEYAQLPGWQQPPPEPPPEFQFKDRFSNLVGVWKLEHQTGFYEHMQVTKSYWNLFTIVIGIQYWRSMLWDHVLWTLHNKLSGKRSQLKLILCKINNCLENKNGVWTISDLCNTGFTLEIKSHGKVQSYDVRPGQYPGNQSNYFDKIKSANVTEHCYYDDTIWAVVQDQRFADFKGSKFHVTTRTYSTSHNQMMIESILNSTGGKWTGYFARV